jgi:hypothetical protein
MIRFRSGHNWKRETSATPKDSFSLQVDGIDLLAAATEESLTTLIPDLVSTVCGLILKGEVLGQVSLPEAHLELLLERRGAEAELKVVDLGRPARLLHRPVRVDLTELGGAAVACGHALIRDLGEASPDLIRNRRIQTMSRALLRVEQGSVAPARVLFRQTGYSYRASAPRPWSFGFEFYDERDLLLCPEGASSLGSLLFVGSIYLQLDGERTESWQSGSGLFLLMLELSRQAADLCHAMELEEDRFEFAPAGIPPQIRCDLRQRSLELNGQRLATDPEAFARAIFELGVAISFGIAERNKAQARNPYLFEMVRRCREGLSHLRTGIALPADESTARIERKRPPATRPLQVSGRLRRLRYAKVWEKHKLESSETGRLIWTTSGPIFASSEMACGWAPDGQLLFRRLATHGIASSADGCVLAAYADRVLGFLDRGKSARWVRSHDGASLAPDLLRRDGLLIGVAEARAVLALSEITGREIWRLVPSRTRRVFVALQGQRALLATESGNLLGLDLHDGQIRYRLRVNLPFIGPTVAWGRRFVAVVGRAEQHAILSADAHGAGAHWTQELALSQPSLPLAHHNRVWVSGERNAQAVVLCFGPTGKLLLEQSLPLGRGPFHLLSVRGSVLLSARNGAAALLNGEGEVLWRLEAAGEELARSVSPCLARGVVIVPGERIRVIEPVGGSVLAEVGAGVELCDLKADSKLSLYLLDEDGSLSAHRLLSHFAVVSGLKAAPKG